MKSITIKIKTNNDAFQHGYKFTEIARILNKISDDLQYNYDLCENIIDLNGNSCGTIKTT